MVAIIFSSTVHSTGASPPYKPTKAIARNLYALLKYAIKEVKLINNFLLIQT